MGAAQEPHTMVLLGILGIALLFLVPIIFMQRRRRAFDWGESMPERIHSM